MLNKFRQVISKTEDHSQAKNKPQNLFLIPEQVKNLKQNMNTFKENIAQLYQISVNHKENIQKYIKLQEKNKVKSEDNDTQYTFIEDLQEIKVMIAQIDHQIKVMFELQGKLANHHQNDNSEDRIKEFEMQIGKYENELKVLRKGEDNNKEILNTLRQQTQLYSKQVKELQQKNTKIQKQLNQKTNIMNNLKEEKKALLQMRNNDSQQNSINPEITALSKKLTETEERLSLETIKLQQKEKEVQAIKRKLQEDRQSLEKIADELKDKELKEKRIMDKYERSKVQIRKFREEKTEFIKKLNLEVADLSEKLSRANHENEIMKKKIVEKVQRIEVLQTEVLKNEGKVVEFRSAQDQLEQVRKEILIINAKIDGKDIEIESLKTTNEQLYQKRRSLLEALEKPINHQIKTLQKILSALQKLYKEYINIVFEQGNVIGFENRITNLLSNVQQIKQDLLL